MPTLEEVMGKTLPTLQIAKRTATGGTPAPIRLLEGSLLPDDPKVRETIAAAAAKNKINPALLFALGQQESVYNPNAIGPDTPWGKAKGMFQYIDDTARRRGIDPFNYEQAANAAAEDMAEQIRRNGVDWAVASHHGGTNPKQHGPKTRQYTREVLAKAQAIAKELGIEFTAPEGSFSVPETKKGFTLEEVMAARPKKVGGVPAAVDRTEGAPAEEESLLKTAVGRLGGGPNGEFPESFGEAVGNLAMAGNRAVKRSVERGWEGIQNALNNDTEEVVLTPDEVRREIAATPWYDRKTMLDTDIDKLTPAQRTRVVSKKTVDQEEREWTERLRTNPKDAYLLPKRLSHLKQAPDDSRFAPATTFKGAMQRIISGHKNPIELLLQDSIPANAITYLATLPETERIKFDQARNVTRALEVDSDPNATAEEQKWSAEQLGTWDAKVNPSITRAWTQLYDAAKTNPGQIGQAFSEALFADPYMVAAPAGVGLKVARTTQKVVAGTKAATIAGRVAKMADQIIDGAVTAGTLNVTAGAMQNLATTGTVNQDEVKLNAAIGIFAGGLLAPLFMKGAKAKSQLHDTAKLRADGTLDEVMADAAKADVELETQVSAAFDEGYGTGVRESPLQKQLREMFGIKTKQEAKAWVAQRRKEVKEFFTNESDYADYQKFVADEKLQRAGELADAAEAKAAREAADAEMSSAEAAVRREAMESEYNKAIEARNAAEATDKEAAWAAHENATKFAAKMDADDLMDALYSQDHPTIKQVENSIKRRDKTLNTPKWQRGSADPETLARLGVVGAGAAAGAYAFPEDKKLEGALFGGFAGLIAPAGGTVLRRMKQSGAIASDGQIIAALTKAGKLVNKLEEGEIKARDTAWIEQARVGDQQGFGQLYNTYFNKIKRFATKYTANRESWLGVDAEDIAQMAFVKAFKKIKEDPDFKIDNFPAFVTTIAENEAKNALTARKADMRGGEAKVVNEEVPAGRDAYEGDSTSGFSLIDKYSDTPGFDVGTSGALDTPEAMAVRDQTLDIVRQALHGLSEDVQQVFSLVHLEHYTLEEAAEVMGISKSGAWHQLRRAENRVAENVAKDKLKYGEPVQKSPQEDLVELYHTTAEKYLKNIQKEGIRGYSPKEINENIAKDLGIDLTEELLDYLDENYWMEDARSNKRRGPFFTTSKKRTADIRGEGEGAEYNFNSIAEGPAAIASDIGNYLEEKGDTAGAARAFAYEQELRTSAPKTLKILLPRNKLRGIYGKLPDDLVNFEGDIVVNGVVRGPRNQRGSADTETMIKTAAITAGITAGGTAAYFMADESQTKAVAGAIFGGIAAAVAFSKGKPIIHTMRGTDWRLKDFGPEFYGLAKTHGKQQFQNIKDFNLATADFTKLFHKLPATVKPAMIRALSTRNKTIINKMLEHFGGKEFVEAFDKVRVRLDEIENQLVDLGLISKSEKDYFPFRVKDLEGLKKALGQDAASEIERAMAAAETKMQASQNRSLNDIEKGIVLNKILEPYIGKPTGTHTPGFGKARTIQEIPEKLQPYYYDPIETLNSYGREAITYIERAKFFGKHLVKKKNAEGRETVSVSDSIGELTQALRNEGKLTDQQVYEMAQLLQDRFNGGEKTSPMWAQWAKTVQNAAFLSHLEAAVTQLADIPIQMLQHGPRASTKALIRQFRRKHLRTLNDFGLDESIGHEFLNSGMTKHISDATFKYQGFRAVDSFGKNFGINASLERMLQEAKSPKGLARLYERYGKVFPKDFDKAIAALKKGEINSEVELMAYADITRTNPLSMWELPSFYQKHPELRILYSLQTYQVRFLNFVWEEAGRKIMSGDVKEVTKGVKALLGISAVIGISNTGTDKIKDLLAGKSIELDPMDIPLNALEAFGFSRYDYARMEKKGPIAGAIEAKTPPFIRLSMDLWNEPERFVKNIPFLGKRYYAYNKEEIEADRKERRKREGYNMEITVAPKDSNRESRRTKRKRPERKRRER